MHRLHEDDLTGHVLAQEEWEIVRLPAVAEEEGNLRGLVHRYLILPDANLSSDRAVDAHIAYSIGSSGLNVDKLRDKKSTVVGNLRGKRKPPRGLLAVPI